MKQIRKYKRDFALFLCVMISIFQLIGCGKDNSQELNEYKASLETIYAKINTSVVSINEIDISVDGAESYMLTCIDQLVANVSELSSLADPVGYEKVGTLANEALSSITQCSSIYHSIYDAENYANYDETKATQAANFYSYTLTKLNEIGYALIGDSATISVNNTSSDSVSGN